MLADFVDAVVCLDLETNTLASKLPGYTKATMDSMGINFGETCVMVYSNNRMIEVNLKQLGPQHKAAKRFALQ